MKKLFFVVLISMIASFAAAEDLKLFSFADALFSSGDYYRAIGEYKRYMFYNPAGKFAEKASIKIIVSYLSAEKWDGAVEAFENPGFSYGPKAAGYALILAAYAYTQKKDFTYSDMLLGRAVSGGAAVDEALYLQAYNRIYTKKWGEAKEYLGKITAEGEMKKSAALLSALMDKSGEIQERSAVLGAIFSAVLPGAGYYYCGRWMDGALATAFNGIFIYNTYNAFAKNDGPMKLVYGIPAVVFYLANIYGSAAAAGKFNEDEAGKFIKAAEDLRVDVLSREF